MAFLESLRATNVFPRRPATDRPFGMPDIDSGNVAELFRQIGPLANSMNDENMRRDKEMMEFEHTLKQPRPAPMSMTQRAYGGGQAPMQGSIAGPSSPIGNFSPMQRMFQARDQQEKEDKFKASQFANERAGKLQQAMAEGSMRNTGEMERLVQEINARKELGTAEMGSRERIAENQLKAKTGETTADRDARVAGSAADRASREKIAGMPARATEPSATQQGNAMENRFQQLAIDNPAAAAILTKDPDTNQIIFKPGSDPKQMEFVRNYLRQQQGSTQQKTITQKNSKGQTRTSTDGGKTWMMQ